MKLKQILSILLAVVLVVSAAAFALAESADTDETAAATEETVTQKATTEETAEAIEPVYTLEEMLTEAMTDAYNRQAAYAAYAEAFSESNSINAIDLDTQIVLLEMLLKANGVALPESTADITVPETKAEAYAAIAEAESTAVTMYKTFLSQEDLAADAQIIFTSVLKQVQSYKSTFTQKAAVAERQAALEAIQNSDSTQVYVISNGGRGGRQVVYVVNNTEDTNEDADTAADETTAEEDDTTDSNTEDSVSN